MTKDEKRLIQEIELRLENKPLPYNFWHMTRRERRAYLRTRAKRRTHER